MSNSYRIRTELGKDKAIQVYLDQDFEFLEILSLKLLQSEIYIRPCSDYGVVVGRVSVNNGFGIPNAKVSIFIPLSTEDENNPIINQLYPYKSLSSTNDDGYRYNLLPYTRQHGGHTPTGTFFDREDVLTNTNIIEVFDKYYKYTARTNESGDFMLFGVPLGPQTIHIDIDLSDIGEFSLSPQDLIRMGIATPSQVAGTNFKSSNNLNELPQIVTIDRIVEVVPLWGQEDLCTIGITRSDFDLSAEANVTIMPTAVFMGSLISSNDDQFLKRSCRPKVKQGSLCNLVTGYGQILAIRQTIFMDTDGRPFLEPVELEQGGQVIDENGTWMIDVPMNLDYVVTNEFGERVISNDPRIGIPTSAKYRFKVKWNQPPTLKDQIKRGYFLVPNVKEWGWNTTDQDPLVDNVPIDDEKAARFSYAFSVDWNDYGQTGTTLGDAMIQEAINCEDRFYPMVYNKVYTVSQMIDQYRKGVLPNRMVSIKNILDEACESENTKFPTNDAVFRFDIIYLLFVIILFIFKPILLILLVVVHILGWLMKWILGPILGVVVFVLFPFIVLICPVVKRFKPSIECPKLKTNDLKKLIKKMRTLYKYFTNLKLPNLSYPDCELCDCKEGDALQDNSSPEGDDPSGTGLNLDNFFEDIGIDSYLTQTQLPQNYAENLINVVGEEESNPMALLVSGQISPNGPGSTVPQLQPYLSNDRFIFTNSLTLSERLNLFNTKAKYFDEDDSSSNFVNPGGGVNRIKVTFQSDLNSPLTTFHYDNVIAILVDPTNAGDITPGTLISFQDPILSKDINITGVTSGNQFSTYSITGTPINLSTPNFPVTYANPNGSGNVTTLYNITQDPDDANYHKFPIDVEYFQVITAMTCSSFTGSSNPGASDISFPKRFLNNTMDFYQIGDQGCFRGFGTINPLSVFDDSPNQIVAFLVRGVDPNSSRRINQYDLSVLFGYPMDTPGYSFTGLTKFNIPIQGSYKSVSHTSMISDTTNPDTTNSTNLPLYYDSFHFKPSTGVGGFSSFTSNLPSYYSSLDNTLGLTFQPSGTVGGTSAPTLGNTADLSTLGTKVLQNFSSNFVNGFQGHFDTNNTIASVCVFPFESYQFVNNLPSYNKGYYGSEIVEGGSYVSQIMRIVPNITPSLSIILAKGYLYSPRYSGNFQFTNNVTTTINKIIMRSDRLPTSTTTQDINNNSLMLHNNPGFALFVISDDGTATSVPQSQNTPNFGDQDEQSFVAEESALGPAGSSVLETFNCTGMVPLGCYEGQAGTVNVLQPPNECYENGSGDPIMQNGCYLLVSKLLTTLINGKDFKLITEWASRIQITFAACRNVWSHIFTNSWINGTLYAFAFKNDRFFTGPDATPPNAPFSLYCRDTVYLHPSNNFYYRSSPYKYNEGFIGCDPPTGMLSINYGGNTLNLKYPTTIMDLGPRSFYQQELSMSDDYDGYVVNNMKGTSYTSVDEILNYLIISRLLNQTFLQGLFGAGGASALSYFNQRSKQFVDGDYAQLISISSEFGVQDFEASNYGSSEIFLSDSNSNDVVIGIFFSSDTQIRDFITPKRQIISPTSTNPLCSFNYFKVFSQEVPFYQWKIEQGDSPNSIFGSQSNNWNTGPVDVNKFFAYKYQSLDRIQPSSRYFRTNGSTQTQYYKGHIYSVNGSGGIDFNYSSWSQNSPSSNVITAGNPFHFYFGLKKGRTAFDRFARQWINFDIITE